MSKTFQVTIILLLLSLVVVLAILATRVLDLVYAIDALKLHLQMSD